MEEKGPAAAVGDISSSNSVVTNTTLHKSYADSNNSMNNISVTTSMNISSSSAAASDRK